MPPEKFRVALVQMSCGPEPEQNLEKALTRVADAAGRGANVVCLPELFQTQYFCQREDVALFDLAEPIPGPATKRLGDVARELNLRGFRTRGGAEWGPVAVFDMLPRLIDAGAHVFPSGEWAERRKHFATQA